MKLLAPVLIFGCLFMFSVQAWAQPVCAKGYISLRKGPGTKHPLSWRVAKYMPFLLLEKKNGWGKLQDLDGEIHWAQLSDLNTKDRCVVVKVNVAVLRQQPSNRSSPPAHLRTVDRYTPFKRVDTAEEWIKVEDEAGNIAWIHENYVWKPVIVNSFTF